MGDILNFIGKNLTLPFFFLCVAGSASLLIIFVILVLGVEIRTADSPWSIYNDNISSYYFHHSNYLNDTGHLPAADIWSFGPNTAQENIPPFLAFFSVFIYKILNVAAHWGSFYNFALAFPAVIFVLWGFSGFLIFLDLYKNYYHGLVFLFLLTLIPASLALTHGGSYSEQILGAFLVFVSIYFFIKATQKNIFFVFLGLSLLGLVLTWQQFPVLYAAMLVYLTVSFIAAKGKNYRQTIFYLLAIGLPLILGHFISKSLMHIDYSPLLMIKELVIGLINYKNAAINIAMSRRDWGNLNLPLFINYFGILGGVLIVVGFLKLATNGMVKTKNLFLVIFGLVSFFMMFFFVKDRFLALPVLLFVMVEGFDAFWKIDRADLNKMWVFLGGLFIKIKSLYRVVVAKKTKILLFLLVLTAVFIWLIVRNQENKIPPKADTILTLAKDVKVGEVNQVSIVLENVGGPAFQVGASFSGLHIEVENALVKNIRTVPGGYDNVVLKNDFSRGNLFWFEVKFPPLKASEQAKVFFDIMPFAKPVSIYYRAWLPNYCPLEKQLARLGDLRTSWQSLEQGGWRNEECIVREPANDDSKEAVCPVRVYAAHEETQDFRCLVRSF